MTPQHATRPADRCREAAREIAQFVDYCRQYEGAEFNEEVAAILARHFAEPNEYKRLLENILFFAGGCPRCEYDEAEGGLFYCEECIEKIAREVRKARTAVAALKPVPSPASRES